MNSYSQQDYPLFHQLPLSLRTLYLNVLVVLGIGYIFAMIQIYEVHAGRDGQPGLSVKDIQIAYRGDRSDTRLEAALKGPMNSMLSEQERAIIADWVRGGGDETAYQAQVEPVIASRCQMCHDGSNPHIPTLMTYTNVKALTHVDTGVSVVTLVRVSHIHLFGLTFIFGFMGLIFSHAAVHHPNFKAVVICVPFFAIFLDIASWWLTKVSTVFSYTVVVGGGLMGLSFAYQWLVSAYQLIFLRPRSES